MSSFWCFFLQLPDRKLILHQNEFLFLHYRHKASFKPLAQRVVFGRQQKDAHMERPENTNRRIHSAPYVGIGQQVQRVRFYLLNYAVVPLLFNYYTISV
jgi:hypothetical protein